MLQKVWAASGYQCGKYLAVSMSALLDSLDHHGELVDGTDRYSPSVRAELEAMSAATIDRYLAPARAKDRIGGISTTQPSQLLRSSISIRKAGDEVEAEPGFFEGDTAAHCGPTLKGEFARTLNLTNVHTGWVYTHSVRNNTNVHILAALTARIEQIPNQVTGLDFDNGSEFLNHNVINWAADRDIFFTRSRPYKMNDQATIVSKNNHLVRRYGFYYRYDTPAELRVRNRLLAARTLSPTQAAELTAYRDQLNPVDPACRITDDQATLIKLPADKTDQLRRANTRPLPDTSHGIKLQPTG